MDPNRSFNPKSPLSAGGGVFNERGVREAPRVRGGANASFRAFGLSRFRLLLLFYLRCIETNDIEYQVFFIGLVFHGLLRSFKRLANIGGYFGGCTQSFA